MGQDGSESEDEGRVKVRVDTIDNIMISKIGSMYALSAFFRVAQDVESHRDILERLRLVACVHVRGERNCNNPCRILSCERNTILSLKKS